MPVTTLITVSPRAILAVAAAVAKADVRDYLNGVHFAASPTMGVRVTGCDGHRVYVARDTEAGRTNLPRAGVVIPLDPLLKLAKMDARPTHEYKFAADVAIEVTEGEGDAPSTFKASRLGASFTGDTIPGRYPDIDAIMPLDTESDVGCTGHFNPDYILDAVKAIKTLQRTRPNPSRYPSVSFVPSTAERTWSLVSCPDDTVTLTCVVMPLRPKACGPWRRVARHVLN
jgi:DNA polymerase III sliding clamp (beta) subunit (PCNA family)